MSNASSSRAAQIRHVIDEFLAGRLQAKLDKLKQDCPPEERETLLRQFEIANWLEDAARRASQIQTVTHSLKPIHPDARGTNIYCPPTELPDHDLLGSHTLGPRFDDDVVGNAAALDVYKFLKLSVDGASLLDLMCAGDEDLLAVLSDDAAQATTWMAAFTSVTQPRGAPATHTLAKQVYWLTGDDPCDDGHYHLLAPLFATSLTHRVYQTIQADRFSEESVSARRAKREGQFSDRDVHDYPNLAVQSVGGTKPQNISQLNSERRGNNYLLASLPPRWTSLDVKPLLRTDSMLTAFEWRADVRRGIQALRLFLDADPAANAATRARRDALVLELVGELLSFRAELRTLPPGWSQSPDCRLSEAERHWLDPDAAGVATGQAGSVVPADNSERISQAFGRWLNRRMRDPLPMGDPEYLHWCALAKDELDAEEQDLTDD